jgi:hypothetical protein
VELTRRLGLGDPRHLEPMAEAGGPVGAHLQLERALGGRDDWGAGEDLRTWSGPRAARFAWRARRAELRLATRRGGQSQRALRELLALQSSDWAFLHDRNLSGDYPEERAVGHEAALHGALAAGAGEPALRSLAPWLEGWGLSRPSGTCAARAGSG